jgi:hypothetical protein
MVKVKDMPYIEKYKNVQDYIKHEALVPEFIEKNLGKSAVVDFQRICNEGIKPISEETPPEVKYEAAYSNWIYMGRSAFKFVRDKMGEEGIKQFVRADVDALKRENAGPALILIGFIKIMSTGLAFSMVSKQMVYKLQWLGSYSVPELTRRKTVLTMPRCKILDYPDSDDLCFIGCQKVYPIWMAEQFRIRMEANRQGNSCTLTLTPMK